MSTNLNEALNDSIAQEMYRVNPNATEMSMFKTTTQFKQSPRVGSEAGVEAASPVDYNMEDVLGRGTTGGSFIRPHGTAGQHSTTAGSFMESGISSAEQARRRCGDKGDSIISELASGSNRY